MACGTKRWGGRYRRLCVTVLEGRARPCRVFGARAHYFGGTSSGFAPMDVTFFLTGGPGRDNFFTLQYRSAEPPGASSTRSHWGATIMTHGDEATADPGPPGPSRTHLQGGVDCFFVPVGLPTSPGVLDKWGRELLGRRDRPVCPRSSWDEQWLRQEHIFLSRQVGVPYIIVFLNKCDMVDDPELIELVEMEVTEQLEEYGFNDCPIIKGSALKALEDPNGEWGDKIMELMDTVDSYIPDPERDTDKPFLMPVEDVFTITGRGTVATGRVERGTLHLNDELEILGVKEDVLKTVVTGIEMFRKQLDEAMAGDNIGALLRGVNRDQIVRGQVLAKPGTVTCHHKFTAQVYVLTKDEGGRHSNT